MKLPTAITALSLSITATTAALAVPGGSCDSRRPVVRTASYDHHSADIVTTAAKASIFKTLAAALDAADLVDALQGDGPFTVFAPTDEAFAKLPAGTVESLLKPKNKEMLQAVLTYHVVSGEVPASKVVNLNNAETLNGQRVDIMVEDGSVMIDNATVIKTDIQCSNGIIHVIDEVILPSTLDIVDTGSEAGKFNTLLAAAKAAGLVGWLKSDGPFTVLAPTDDAFGKLPNGTVETLLKPENRHMLTDILKYHIIQGRVYAGDAAGAGRAATTQGDSVRFGFDDGQLAVNNANIIMTDIEATNGVVHVIDTVLLPPGM